jgi:hypothetical protein
MISKEDLKKEIDHIIESGVNSIRLIELFERTQNYQTSANVSKSIREQLKEIEIKEDVKSMISKLIESQLFRAIICNSAIKSIKLRKHQNKNDSRVFLKVDVFINDSKIGLYTFRPFIDVSCNVSYESNSMKLSKTYYLYDG